MQKEDAACFACGDCSHDCASCTAAGGLSVCELSEWPFPSPPTAVALGFFDGVHSGHRALLRFTAEEAAKRGLVPTVFSFREGSGIKATLPRISTPSERYTHMAACGIARVALADFAALRDLAPAAFVRDILVARLDVRLAVCGENFRFGRGGAGDANLLKSELATHGVPLFVLPTEKVGGEAVSSSAIRAALEAGEAEKAAALLGRPFSLTGKVLHGRALGRTVGLPTANQVFPAGSVLPACGVYAVRVRLGGRTLRGIANVGRHPTVAEGDALNCETHILDFSEDIYGRTLTVEFLSRLRPEKKFENIEALVRAIHADIETAERMQLWNGQN